MKRSDLKNIADSYLKLIKEDLGLGAQNVGSEGISTLGVNFPDNQTPQNYEDQAKEMSIADLKNTIKNATEILNELKSSKKLEAWVAKKITLATDYLDTVESWISNKR